MTDRALLSEGKNCWRITQASRFAWLIDADAYFRALRDCIEAARHEILIVGWDIDSKLDLIRDPDHPHYPSPLAETLRQAVADRADLRIFILSWDFAMVYMLERQLFPAFRFGWNSGERLSFELDGCHATGASHHQKFVVIDGTTAFTGGIDLTRNRWDTPDHTPHDERRTNHLGETYRPFHDIQALVTGDTARTLRELGAERWEAATGRALPALEAETSPPIWPADFKAQAHDVCAAIARTWADPANDKTCGEVEQLFLDLIARARRYIYIENQYFTSDSITDALCERLAGQDGPEIVLVLPGETSGWLEQATMELLREHCLARLHQADEHGRLLTVFPEAPQSDDEPVMVHAKLMIVDDRWIRIGSANLSARSMGLDTECDLLIDAESNDAARRILTELLAEHLDADARELAETLEAHGLLATIRRHGGNRRRLSELSIVEPEALDTSMQPLARIVDLERPIEQAWANAPDHDNDDSADNAGWAMLTPLRWVTLALLIVIFITWVAWRVFGGDTGVSADLFAAVTDFADHPLAPVAAVLVFVAGSFVIAPVTGMIAGCALLFGPWVASVTAMAGVLASAAANYAIARRFRGLVFKHAPRRVIDAASALADASDIWSVAGLRMVPIAPFTVFNIVAGACGVRPRDFMLGTLAGMAPGTILICLAVDRARAAWRDDEAILNPWVLAVMAAAGVALILLRIAYRRRAD